MAVHFRLTMSGWIFLAISLTVGAAGVNSQAPLSFVLFGAMMGALHVSAVMARRNVAGVSIRREAPGRVWQNQVAHVGYFLRNERRWGSSLGLYVEELPAEGMEWVPAYCLHLPRRSVFRSGGRFVAHTRGRRRLREIRVSTTFPFGLIRAFARYPCDHGLVVWPARGKVLGRLLPRGAVEISNSAPSPATGGQDEFFGLREYRPDDNPRWIHWRRSAGRASPVVREMARTRPDVLWVLLDAATPGEAPEAVQAREKLLRFTATVVDVAFARGYRVGMALAGEGGILVHAPAPGLEQRARLLDALADVDDAPAVPPAALAARVGAPALQNATVLLVTIAPGTAPPPLLNASRSVNVVDPQRCDRIFADERLPTPPEARPCP